MKYGSKNEAKKWAMEKLRGGLVATIPTPFRDDTMEIHEKDLRSLARYCVETKNDAIFILGNVGEFYCLTQEERKKVAEIVIDEVQGEIAVIVPPILVIGAVAALASLELDFGSGFFHYGLYVLATVLLRMMVGMTSI